MADLPEPLLAYLTERENQRATAVKDFLNKLTPRERGIFHDAAVMGYVQGLMRDRSEGVPKDSQTMALVADACFTHPDLYPVVNAIARIKTAPEPVWQIETLQRGTWRTWLGPRNDATEARSEYDQCVDSNGHRWAYRLVRTDTTRVVEAQHVPQTDDEPEEAP
jgi:hypothetical protein